MLMNASPTVVLGITLSAATLAASPASALAQRPIPMKVTVTAAGRTETSRGTGRCAHEPRASLHGAAVALWLAEFSGGSQALRVSLRYWRFAGGGDGQFNLAVNGKTAEHRISTVKGGKLEGSGRVSFQPTAQGGRFQIDGKTQDGAPLQATIECARFDGITAEGG